MTFKSDSASHLTFQSHDSEPPLKHNYIPPQQKKTYTYTIERVYGEYRALMGGQVVHKSRHPTLP